MATIPPDIRATIEQFYQKQLRERFGDTPPTVEEEIAFLKEWEASGVPTVPLPDGSEVTQPASPVGPPEAGETAVPTGKSSPVRRLAGLLLVVIPLLVGAYLLWPRSDAPAGSSGQGPAALATLPASIDALVSSGGVRGGGVVPRSLEIAPGDSVSSTQFIVVAVEVKQADWPCPVRKFDGQPAACWVYGTVTNYLIGIPRGPEIEALADRLRVQGGTLRLRLSTEKVLTFQATVKEVERHQTEVLAQKRFGLTIPILNAPGDRRTLIVGEYDAGQDVGKGSLPSESRPIMEESVTILMGENVTVGELALTATGASARDGVSRLSIEARNLGQVALVAGYGWPATALLQDGSTRPAQAEAGGAISPGQTVGCVFSVADEGVVGWRIVVGGRQIVVALP